MSGFKKGSLLRHLLPGRLLLFIVVEQLQFPLSSTGQLRKRMRAG